MLEHYSSRLNGVEVNGTFHRTPPESTLRAWGRTPEAFRLCLKAHRALTYSAAGFPKAQVALDFATRVGVLGDRLGPVLLQFPPVRKRDPGLLRELLQALGRPAAAEFRDGSWFDGEVADVLRDHGSAWAITDADAWPMAPPADFAFAYYRLRREYDDLSGWAERLRRELQRGVDVHVYFKHDVEGPFHAERLQTMVRPPLTESV
jgi:uncharacterized protein YecE (DUF72 family)